MHWACNIYPINLNASGGKNSYYTPLNQFQKYIKFPQAAQRIRWMLPSTLLLRDVRTIVSNVASHPTDTKLWTETVDPSTISLFEGVVNSTKDYAKEYIGTPENSTITYASDLLNSTSTYMGKLFSSTEVYVHHLIGTTDNDTQNYLFNLINSTENFVGDLVNSTHKYATEFIEPNSTIQNNILDLAREAREFNILSYLGYLLPPTRLNNIHSNNLEAESKTENNENSIQTWIGQLLSRSNAQINSEWFHEIPSQITHWLGSFLPATFNTHRTGRFSVDLLDQEPLLDPETRATLGTNPNLSDKTLLASWRYVTYMIGYGLLASTIGIVSIVLFPDPQTLERIENSIKDNEEEYKKKILKALKEGETKYGKETKYGEESYDDYGEETYDDEYDYGTNDKDYSKSKRKIPGGKVKKSKYRPRPIVKETSYKKTSDKATHYKFVPYEQSSPEIVESVNEFKKPKTNDILADKAESSYITYHV